MDKKLKKAKDLFDAARPRSMGSMGRQSAEMQRRRERIAYELGGGPRISVERVPNAKMIMPSKRRMMQEAQMDLMVESDPTFAKEMAKARKGK